MTKTILTKIAGRAAGQAARQHTGDGAFFDPRGGWTLLKDRKIPASTKLLALGLGVGLTFALTAVEVPLEMLLGLFLPFVGVGVDILIDGAEMIIAPVLFAALLMPHLVRRMQAQAPIRVSETAETSCPLPPYYTR